ncbi:unnamed protein product [Caenorhabditis sp. 36 PRJEB53466]|nr:unnamed protein product [Caenorhabditis sp. 36 PRJEB53466]
MGRKRKSGKQLNGNGRSILILLRSVGQAVKHPLLVYDCESQLCRDNGSIRQEVMKMICFAGIPACCLSAKGCGIDNHQAEEAAGHAMIDFFRCALPNSAITTLLVSSEDNLPPSSINQIAPIFKEFEKAISSDFLLINRCSQYDMTSAALNRGKGVKKRVLMNLTNPDFGYSNSSPLMSRDQRSHTDAPNSSNANSEISIDGGSLTILGDNAIEQRTISQSLTQKEQINLTGSDDEIFFLGENNMRDRALSENQLMGIVKMRELDEIRKKTVSDLIAEQNINRKKKNCYAHKEVYFGIPNISRSKPPEVFCAAPNVVSSYTEACSSDSEDSVIKRKLSKTASKSNKKMEINSDLGNVIVHATSGNSLTIRDSSFTKDSDEELGEVVDEWAESDEHEEKRKTEWSHKNGTTGTSDLQDYKNSVYKPNLDNELSIRQEKRIGVVSNKVLVRRVEWFITLVTQRSSHSIMNLSKLAWDQYLNNQQPDVVYDRKMRARQLLFNEIQKLFPDKCISLQVTGSTVNGCGSYNSDTDMCLCYPTSGYRGQNFDDFHGERSFSSKILRKIEKTFRRLPVGHPFKRLVKCCQLIPAKVPIIKLLLNGEFDGIDIDINVNNVAGIYNSHLLHYYSMLDGRVPALALLVKHWAMVAGVNNSQEGYLNSYSLILLVIHFLQCGVQPALLPNLQHIFPQKFDNKIPLEELLLFGDIAKQMPSYPSNTSSLGELTIGFFEYYSHFDFENNAISIRSAQVFSRSVLPKNMSYHPIFIEEPFDAVNTARTVRTINHMNTIRAAFRQASSVFEQQSFKMSDLGVTVVPRN